MPPTESGTQRSRGIESMTTFFVDGLNLTRIIDWVSSWSPMNLVSLSEPRRRTVKAPGVRGDGLAVGPIELSGVGVGEGMSTTLVASYASWMAGRKYAN